jgi:hypothetical protein
LIWLLTTILLSSDQTLLGFQINPKVYTCIQLTSDNRSAYGLQEVQHGCSAAGAFASVSGACQ